MTAAEKEIDLSVIDRILAQTTLEPRDYQRRLASKALHCFNEGVNNIAISSPTGSGKTSSALLVCRALQEQHNIGIAWVAMRRNLLTQAAKENQEKNIGVSGIRFISMFENSPPKEDELGRPIGLIVNDECQHSPTSSAAHLYNHLTPQYSLGLSATCYRTDRVKVPYNKIIRDIGIQQLIDMGYLSKYHHYVIPEWSVDTVVETFLREPERWGKSAIYWHRREHAIDCANRLKAAGIKVETVFGDDPDREERLQRFDNGETDVLVNMIVLTEGWDSPSLKTVFVRDSVKLPTVQACGRVFRKYPGIPYKQVVQSKHTSYPISKEALPAESFAWLDGMWRSYKLSPEINKVAMRALMSGLNADSQLPDYLQKRKAQAELMRRGRERRRQVM